MPAFPMPHGRERLSSGSGVLDIAGGRGAVSFELSNVLGIRCTPSLLHSGNAA